MGENDEKSKAAKFFELKTFFIFLVVVVILTVFLTSSNTSILQNFLISLGTILILGLALLIAILAGK